MHATCWRNCAGQRSPSWRLTFWMSSSELFSPISGEITAVNERLDKEPALVNTDPYGVGWMIRMRIADKGDLDTLLSAGDYTKQIG